MFPFILTGVKEASERAILQLRTLQNQYVMAVRRASQIGEAHPTTAIFQSQDLLRPFLLAANYPNASPHLLDISLKGMALLLQGDAICPGDGIHMVRVWTIQANVCASSLADKKTMPRPAIPSSATSWLGNMLSTSTPDVSSSAPQSHKRDASEKLALDLLRCLIQLVDKDDMEVTDEQWTASVNLCCILGSICINVVHQAAKATLHQVLGILYQSQTEHTVNTWNDMLHLVLRENTELTGAFQSGKIVTPSPTLCLELMNRLLREHSAWFQRNSDVVVHTRAVATTLLKENVKSFELVWRSYALASSILIFEVEEGRAKLLEEVVRAVVKATEDCRTHHDFEDGYIFLDEVYDPKAKGARPLATLIPDSLLWRAGLALETLYMILEKNLGNHIVAVAEAISDFATIGASCRDHILQLTEIRLIDDKIPSLLRKAEEIQSTATTGQKSSEAKTTVVTSCHMGESLSIAVSCIFLIAKISSDAFAPTLAVLQHFLKRFPGSNTIIEKTLVAYSRLARVIQTENALQSSALLASLCKLSLPSWGKKDSNCQLQDHHTSALLCLLNIIHQNYDHLGTEWNIVMRTFEELSTLSVASSKLSDQSYQDALAISLVYSRIAPLTTCMSVKSLTFLLDALVEIAIVSTNKTFANDEISDFEGAKKGSIEAKESGIGGKLLGFAGRALLGNQSPDTHDGPEYDSVPEVTKRVKKMFFGDYRKEFLQRVTISKRGTTMDIRRSLSFSLMVLTDTAFDNTFRYRTCALAISSHLCELTTSSAVRNYAMETFSLIVASELSEDCPLPAAFVGPSKLLTVSPMPKELLAVVSMANRTSPNEVPKDIKEPLSQVDLLSPLCDTIRQCDSSEVAEVGIVAIQSILENTGHHLSEAVWAIVIDTMSSLAGDPPKEREQDRTGSDWSACCMVAFRCLKLIVDEFLEHLPPLSEDSSMAPRINLLECCFSFGSSRHDVNISLTSVGLLWTIADQDTDTTSIDKALSKLVLLCSDSRTEVRNCAVNTLFSCIVGRGQSFSELQWEVCICTTVFDVYEAVLLKGGGVCANALLSETNGVVMKETRYKVNVHHSRDSVDKQWAGTELLVLQGLSRVLRHFFPRLLATTEIFRVEVGKSLTNLEDPWFFQAWIRILRHSFNAAKQSGGRDTLDLRIAGTDLIILCNQLSCQEGIQAALTPARVGTNMEVVNGALRSVRNATGKSQTEEAPISETVDKWRREMFMTSFDILDEYRDFVEHDEAEERSKETKYVYLESTQVHVLQRLTTGLGKLYECCKNHELSPERCKHLRRRPSSAQRYLAVGSVDTVYKEDLEGRFVQLIATIIKNAVGDQGTRYLTHAQREAFDLLRTMVAGSSNEALRVLAVMAGSSFFWLFVPSETDEHDEESDLNAAIFEVLGREAAKVVAEEISKGSIAHETKVQVLCRILSVFVAENDKDCWTVELSSGKKESKEHKKKRSYTLLVPVMEAGVTSAAELEKSESDSDFSLLLELLWEKVLTVLVQMLTPIQSISTVPYISQTSNLAELVNSAVTHIPDRKKDDLCSLLENAVTISMDVARGHALDKNGDSEKRKFKKRHDEALSIGRECFGGLCRLNPDSVSLRLSAKKSLQDALDSLMRNGGREDDINVEIALALLQAIKSGLFVEGLVIHIFPQLCKLLTIDSPRLRAEVGKLMESVDIGKALADASTRLEATENKVELLERENEDLLTAIDELREENERLHRDVAIFSASSALT